MIEVFCLKISEEGDWVEAESNAMVLGYRLVTLAQGQAPDVLGEGVSLPAIRQDGKLINGLDKLLDHLHELDRFAEDWRAFQSDACNVTDSGGSC